MELTPPVRGVGEVPAAVFRSIVDLTGNPFLVIGPDGVVRYAGASVAGVIGWDPAELVGRSIVELLPPDQVAVAVEGIAEVDTVNRTADGLPMVFGVLRPDGSITHVEVAALPILDLGGGDGIALRLRSWEGQHHFDGFLAAMLDGEPLDVLLAALCRSVAASTGSAGAVVHHGFDGSCFASAPGWAVDAGLAAAVGATGLGLDTESALGRDELPAAVVRAGFEAVWTTPVPASHGIPPAVLSVWRTSPGAPLLGHRHVLERSVRYVQLALVRTAEHQRLRHLAAHDSLTGVANRRQFRDRLAGALAVGERDLAVAFCDLDRFKPVNDTFGHSAGDAVLVEAAARLRSGLRAGDELARLGGDEFTVLLRNVADADAATHVAERLLATMRQPFVLPSGASVEVGLSVGVALWREGATADGLLADADEALYASKRAGGGVANVSARR